MREQIIIQKIKKGDQSALDSFIKEHYPQVYSFAFRKMKGDDIAKDITQEVFLRFIKNLPLYHCEGKTLHYLFRITSNLCHDHFRKMNREQYYDIDETEYLLAHPYDVHEAIIQQIQKEQLLLFIATLPEEQQDVILLKYFHQMTFKEIAECFSLPVSTIKSRHVYALKKLTHLWKEGEPHG